MRYKIVGNSTNGFKAYRKGFIGWLIILNPKEFDGYIFSSMSDAENACKEDYKRISAKDTVREITLP